MIAILRVTYINIFQFIVSNRSPVTFLFEQFIKRKFHIIRNFNKL